MKCHVCFSTFEGGKCPICQFPVITFMGNPEEELMKMRPQIDQCRDQFLNKLEIGIVSYHWKDADGNLALDYKQSLPVANGKQLTENAVWLKQEFSRIPDQKTLTLALSIRIDDRTFEKKVTVPNIPEPGLQQIGMMMNRSMEIRLMLRNSSRTVQSDWIPLFT